jgi:hypothetical protein
VNATSHPVAASRSAMPAPIPIRRPTPVTKATDLVISTTLAILPVDGSARPTVFGCLGPINGGAPGNNGPTSRGGVGRGDGLGWRMGA